MTGEEVPQDVLDAAQRGYSMHGAGLTANLIAAAWPAIEKHIRDRTPTGDRDQHSPAGRVWPVHGIWYWRPRPGTRCLHRSHRLRLPCLRGSTYDHQCGKHNDSCFNGCREAP